MWSWPRQALANRDFRRSQLHILGPLKRLQPIENCGVSAPRSARLTWNRFDPAYRPTLHLQIDFRVTVRRGRTGVSQILADRRQIDPGLQQRYGHAVTHAVRMEALFVEIRKVPGSALQTRGENVADAEPGQRLVSVIQKHERF